ncbi:MAG: hypothetical protein ACE5EK_05765 [Nitrospinales bacterium]
MKRATIVIIFLLGIGVGTFFNNPLWGEAEQGQEKVHLIWGRGGCYAIYKDSITHIDRRSPDRCLGKDNKPYSFDPFIPWTDR